MQKCNHCGQHIICASSQTGHFIRLDEAIQKINPERKGSGTVAGYTRDMLLVRGIPASSEDIAAGRFVEVRECHFSSCPKAKHKLQREAGRSA